MSLPTTASPSGSPLLRFDPIQGYGPLLGNRIVQTNLLIVGAGGIGCELLKTVAFTGFARVSLVDLDTIELSNLSRQFLFREQHIGMSKALVAREMIKQLVPLLNVQAFHGNVKDRKMFPLKWWREHDLILSALDNADARSHVNSMAQCLGIPVIESGTAGFLGQSTVILPRGLTECFDCKPREVPKVFPVCTIRSTPSAPIHCVVWAKEWLFGGLFASTGEDAAPPPHHQEGDEALSEEQSRDPFKQVKALDDPDEFARALFLRVFCSDIERLALNPEMWKDKQAPVPMGDGDLSRAGKVSFESASEDEHCVWPIERWIRLFLTGASGLWARLQAQRIESTGPEATEAVNQQALVSLQFDKDDDEMLDFVSSASNLRARIFGIPLTSKFEVKAMAGNIIPAVATTNAMAASLVVIKAIEVLRWQMSPKGQPEFRTTYITNQITARKHVFVSELLNGGPNPACTTCNVHRASLSIRSLEATRLKQVIDCLAGGFKDFDFDFESCSIIEGSRLLYDPDFTTNGARLLGQLAVQDSCFLTFAPEDQEQDLPIVVSIEENNELGEGVKLLNVQHCEHKIKQTRLEWVITNRKEEEERRARSTAKDLFDGQDQSTVTLLEESSSDIEEIELVAVAAPGTTATSVGARSTSSATKGEGAQNTLSESDSCDLMGLPKRAKAAKIVDVDESQRGGV